MNKKETLIAFLLCVLVAPFAIIVGVTYMGLLAMKVPVLVWLSAIAVSTWISKPIARRIENHIAKDEIDECYSTVDDFVEIMQTDCFEYQKSIPTPKVSMEKEPIPTFDFSFDVSNVEIPMENELLMSSAWQDYGSNEYSDASMIHEDSNDSWKTQLNMEEELLMSSAWGADISSAYFGLEDSILTNDTWGQPIDYSQPVNDGHKQYTR